MGAAMRAAFPGVAGVAIGRLWDTRSESTRWRRDQKTASYQRFAEQWDAMGAAIWLAANSPHRLSAIESEAEHFKDARWVSWENALASVGSRPLLDRRVTVVVFGQNPSLRRKPLQQWPSTITILTGGATAPV